MHILFLTDNFPPETNAPASRTFEHCREWVRAGHRVTVITGAPNFPRGRLYDGYRNRLWQTERMDGIRVVRVWTYIAANEGFARRIADYLSFMVSAVAASPWVRGADVVVGTSPQFFTACAAWAVSRCKGVPFVFELRDLWPESIKAVGAMGDSPVIRLFERLEMALYRRAARIVPVTESFRRVLVERGVDPGKIAVVTNGVDAGRFRPRPRDPALAAELGLEGRFVAGYVGTHGLAHALETVLGAARLAKANGAGEDVRFLLLGDGARKRALVAEARRQGLDNVVFVDPVGKDEVARYWSLLDAAIIHLRDTALFRTVIPSKLFECMAMGIPVLHGVPGESAEIVRREGCGVLFEPENPADLWAKVLALKAGRFRRSDLGQRGLAAARRYDRAELAARMLRVLEAAASGAAPEPGAGAEGAAGPERCRACGREPDGGPGNGSARAWSAAGDRPWG